MNEDKLQAECFKWANNNFCLKHHNPRLSIFSVPNGGSRNKIEAMKLVSTGLKAGVADLIALFPNGKCVFFELKYGNNKQETNQIDFQNTVNNLGFDYYLIYTFEQFQSIWLSYIDL